MVLQRRWKMGLDWKAAAEFGFALGNVLIWGFMAAMVVYWWRNKDE